MKCVSFSWSNWREEKDIFRRNREEWRVMLTQIALWLFNKLKISFSKIWKNPIPSFAIFLLTVKYCRLSRSVINFVGRLPKAGQESSLYQGKDLIIMTSKRKCVGQSFQKGRHAPIFRKQKLSGSLLLQNAV